MPKNKKDNSESDTDSDSGSDSDSDSETYNKKKIALGVGVGLATIIGGVVAGEHWFEQGEDPEPKNTPPAGGTTTSTHTPITTSHSNEKNSWYDDEEDREEENDIAGNTDDLDDDKMAEIGQSGTLKALLLFYLGRVRVSPNDEMYYGTDNDLFKDSILGKWKELVDNWPDEWHDIEHIAINYQSGGIMSALFGPDISDPAYEGTATGGRHQYPLYSVFDNHADKGVVIILKLGSEAYEYYPVVLHEDSGVVKSEGLYDVSLGHSQNQASFDADDLTDWVNEKIDSHDDT